MRYELTAFRAQDIEVNVTTGMIIKKGNDYYYYDSLDSRNPEPGHGELRQQLLKKNPPSLTQDDKDGALDWDFGSLRPTRWAASTTC